MTKERFHFLLEQDVGALLRTAESRGFRSMTEMVEAAVRRLAATPVDSMTREGVTELVKQECARYFLTQREMLRIVIQQDVIEAVLDRLEPEPPEPPPDYKEELSVTPTEKEKDSWLLK